MLMHLTPDRSGFFRMSLPARPSWGSLLMSSGHPHRQIRTLPGDWQTGYPIPEGLYLVARPDVAGRTADGRPDWTASFGPRMPGPICLDLIPAWRHQVPLAVRFHICAGQPGQVRGSDVYLDSQRDIERLHEWSQQAPLDLLAVDYGLGPSLESYGLPSPGTVLLERERRPSALLAVGR